MNETESCAYSETDELNRTGAEAKTGQACEDKDEAYRVSIELEPNRLWEQHRSHQCTLGRVEA